MDQIVSGLTIGGVVKAFKDVGIKATPTTLDGTSVECASVARQGNDIYVYIQQNQSLCFQSVIKKTSAGFWDVATHWNTSRRFSRVFPCLDGYMMRFEADISHGVTRENLRALILSFERSVTEFSTFVSTSPRSPLP